MKDRRPYAPSPEKHRKAGGLLLEAARHGTTDDPLEPPRPIPVTAEETAGDLRLMTIDGDKRTTVLVEWFLLSRNLAVSMAADAGLSIEIADATEGFHLLDLDETKIRGAPA